LSLENQDRPGLSSVNGTHRFVGGSSAVMRALQRVVERVSNTDLRVLIIGEPGSGKRALAMELHYKSDFAGGGFHEYSAERFAIQFLGNGSMQRMGFDGQKPGTIYLPEIGTLAPEAQAALQAYLSDEGSAVRKPRLIASSSRDLDPASDHNSRPDLYYMVSSVCLRVPALRHRKEDIPDLVSHFLDRYCALLGTEHKLIGEPLQKLFQEHSWPRNVRELEEAVRALVAIGDERIALGALRSAIQQEPRREMAAPISLKDAGRAASRRVERELILQVLARTRWNRKRAAEELRISYKALLYKLKQIGLEDESAVSQEFSV
jgi:two-component system response regulator AtoC